MSVFTNVNLIAFIKKKFCWNVRISFNKRKKERVIYLRERERFIYRKREIYIQKERDGDIERG